MAENNVDQNAQANPDILPAVAKSFFSFCKKCDADRYHTVLAHKSASSAKVKCEVCGAQSTYTLPSVKKAAAAKAGARLKAISAAARASSHQNEYDKLMNESTGDKVTYNMKLQFKIQQKLDHPKFGLGVIRMAQVDKIEVVFPDEVRSLIHNRK